MRNKDLTVERTRAILDRAWEMKSLKMNWLALEDILVSILGSEVMIDQDKVKLSKEAMEAYTKRGQFGGEY